MYSYVAPDDGRRNRLKHCRAFCKNISRNVASCWL